MIEILDPKLPEHFRALRALTYHHNLWKTGESHEGFCAIPDFVLKMLPDDARATHYRIFWHMYGYNCRIDFYRDIFAGSANDPELEPTQSIIMPMSRNIFKCTYCDGSGITPHTDGQGVVTAKECVHCRGVGAFENRRVSELEDPVPPAETCPECGGTRFMQKVTDEQLLQKDPVDGWVVLNTVKRAGAVVCEKCGVAIINSIGTEEKNAG